MKKKMIALFLVLTFITSLLILPSAASSAVYATTTADELRELSPQDCLALAISHGIEIPDDYDNPIIWGEFIQTTIAQVLDNPNIHFLYSYDKTLTLANEVKRMVLEIVGFTASNGSRANPPYVLQDSVQLTPWDPVYQRYNCYAYALGRNERYYLPGYFSGQSYSQSQSIYTLAEHVQDDLHALGNECVHMTTTYPSSVAPSQTAICLRKGDCDFHLMRLVGTSWEHKPGDSAPLRYLYLPYEKVWTNEGVSYTTYAGNTTYDSTIYYFVYKTGHRFPQLAIPIDEFSHAKTCLDCGDTVSEEHTWTLFFPGYQCTGCNMIVNSIPDIMETVQPSNPDA